MCCTVGKDEIAITSVFQVIVDEPDEFGYENLPHLKIQVAFSHFY